MSSAHTGANGDTSTSFLGAATGRPAYETDPATAFNESEPNPSANTTLDKGRGTLETAFGSADGVVWRAPEGRGGMQSCSPCLYADGLNASCI